MEWSDSPIVTFSRDGESFELGRGPDDPVLHLYGSTGLGLAPVEIKKARRVTGDGSVTLGVRYADRDVYVPLLIEAESVGALSEIRRGLHRLLAPHLGQVDIRVQDPATGTDRMIRGLLKDGMDGDFGQGFHGDWQTIGLTFECHDPWWLGPERVRTLSVAPGSKPFLSAYQYSRRNLAQNPRFDSLRAQFGAGSVAGSSGATAELVSDWSARGTTALKITPNGSNNASAAFLMPHTSDVRGASLAGGSVTVGLDYRLAAGQSGSLSSTARSFGIGIVDSSGSASIPAENWSSAAPNAAGVTRLVKTVTVPDGAQGIYVAVRNGSVATPVWVDGVTVEAGDTDGSYFDGDEGGARWLGAPGASESGLVVAGSGTPFFPVVLAPSNVVGEFDVPIEGDGEVWPTWEVTGPGRDLLIERGSERIYIGGDFPAGSPVRVDTRNGRIVPDRWDDVSLDSALFSLRPGPNRLRVTMTGATPDTLVRLVWHERYLEGI